MPLTFTLSFEGSSTYMSPAIPSDAYVASLHSAHDPKFYQSRMSMANQNYPFLHQMDSIEIQGPNLKMKEA